MIGIFNKNTREIRYLQVEPRPVFGQLTYKAPSAIPISAKPKVTSNKIELAGKAGSYADGIDIVITPSSGTYSAASYSAALITVSNWQYFDSTSSYPAAFIGVGNPNFRLD